MLPLPTYETKASDALCRDIAKRSRGVCFLGFSGGKDSLCAWLQLRKYFDRIIPFHCATLPGMTYRERALKYYEYEFGTHILRLMDPNIQSDLTQGIYQLREDGPFIESLGWRRYDKLELIDYLRMVYSLPRAWCAFGIQASDSIDRRIQCKQYEGRHDSNRTFYPCWDWPHEKVVGTVREAGLKLSSEYLYSSRTIEGTPSATYTEILRKHFPRDYEVLRTFYPLCEAKVKREQLNEAVGRELMLARAAAAREAGARREDEEPQTAGASWEVGAGTEDEDATGDEKCQTPERKPAK